MFLWVKSLLQKISGFGYGNYMLDGFLSATNTINLVKNETP